MKNQKQPSPWQERFMQLGTDAAIVERITIPGTPLKDAHLLAPYCVRAVVLDKLDSFYRPSGDDIVVLRDLVNRAAYHSETHYADEAAYNRGVYLNSDKSRRPKFHPPICLTGDAGVGKSSLVAGLSRLFPMDMSVDVDGGRVKVPLQTVWTVTVANQSSVINMLSSIFTPALGLHRQLRQADLTTYGFRVAHRNGVCLFVLDELQFMAQSPMAATLIIKALMQASYLGVPVMFVANESLIVKLENQWQESTHRVLSFIHRLKACTPDSTHWNDYLAEIAFVLGPTFRVDTVCEQFNLFEMSAGVKRILINLIAIAYGRAWNAGRKFVSVQDLNDTYASDNFSGYRREVKAALNSYEKLRRGGPMNVGRASAEKSRELEVAEELAESRKRRVQSAIQLNAIPLPERQESEIAPAARPKRGRKSKFARPADNELNHSTATLQQFFGV